MHREYNGRPQADLYIDSFTPESIPMARLAEYMAGFAELLGHCGHVHLEQEGTLDGEVIQVGGRDETIEIHLTYT